MAPEKKSFVNVDELMPKVSVEQAAAFYGVALPELRRIGAEIRSRCFLHCGKTAETGDRALAIQAEHPAKQWTCHQSGCGKGGNLVSLCDLLRLGETNGGRPRGQRFKAIAADIAAMVAGAVRGTDVPSPAAPQSPVPSPARKNLPLAQSENERARTLTTLDRKFVTDIATMPPKASAYFRRRPYLTPEVCRTWRMGYLPRDSGGEDKSGGTMRGKVVYPWLSDSGEVLTWFGRDPEFEEKHAAWMATDRSEREPEKFHFVKGFQRGLELFGQHALRAPENAEKVKGLGLVVVGGPNDVIRLETLGVPALALCSTTITREQAAKAAALARELGSGVVTVFLGCDEEGEKGMKQCLGYLAQLCPVRLAWTSKMYGGKFRGRQPESLSLEEWREIGAYLVNGSADGWCLT
jgi:hypothetical protein